MRKKKKKKEIKEQEYKGLTICQWSVRHKKDDIVVLLLINLWAGKNHRPPTPLDGCTNEHSGWPMLAAHLFVVSILPLFSRNFTYMHFVLCPMGQAQKRIGSPHLVSLFIFPSLLAEGRRSVPHFSPKNNKNNSRWRKRRGMCIVAAVSIFFLFSLPFLCQFSLATGYFCTPGGNACSSCCCLPFFLLPFFVPLGHLPSSLAHPHTPD